MWIADRNQPADDWGRFTEFRSKNPRETQKQKKSWPADGDGGGKIIETNVNNGWEGEARLAEEEEALTKIVVKM